MISVRQVCKQYHMGDTTTQVLRNISFDIQTGEFVSIVGPSGSGKSTLMHILGCLDVPTSGEYCFQNEAMQDLTRFELARVRNQDIGFVFQNFHLLPRMNALRNVELPMMYAGIPKAERRQSAQALLTSVGLSERMYYRPSALSGGQKQRVAIARALANRPKLLLADEPTGALDQATGREILALLEELHQSGTTVVLITHDMNIAQRAKRVLTIVDGTVQSDVRKAKQEKQV